MFEKWKDLKTFWLHCTSAGSSQERQKGMVLRMMMKRNQEREWLAPERNLPGMKSLGQFLWYFFDKVLVLPREEFLLITVWITMMEYLPLWDFVRSLLCNLVRVKLGCYELECKNSQSVEDYLKAFMETEVKPLWPKGWMQARWVST